MVDPGPWMYKLYETAEEDGLRDMRLLREIQEQPLNNVLAIKAAQSCLKYVSKMIVGFPLS